jgi:glutamate racemase
LGKPNFPILLYRCTIWTWLYVITAEAVWQKFTKTVNVIAVEGMQRFVRTASSMSLVHNGIAESQFQNPFVKKNVGISVISFRQVIMPSKVESLRKNLEKRNHRQEMHLTVSFHRTLLMTDPVIFFDSGVGGLPYLDYVRRRSPETDFLYVADTLNFPYGPKSVEELQSIILTIIRRLHQKYSPQLFVLACNTASVTSLELLRESIPVGFVGVVPAIKPAAQVSHRFAVLATSRTVEDAYTERLIEDFARGTKVVKLAGNALVRSIEMRDKELQQKELNQIAKTLRSQRVDTLVLGCTHFLHVKDELARLFKGDIHMVDSLEGVGNQVLRKITKSGSGEALFCTTGAVEEGYMKYAVDFDLNYCGEC